MISKIELRNILMKESKATLKLLEASETTLSQLIDALHPIAIAISATNSTTESKTANNLCLDKVVALPMTAIAFAFETTQNISEGHIDKDRIYVDKSSLLFFKWNSVAEKAEPVYHRDVAERYAYDFVNKKLHILGRMNDFLCLKGAVDFSELGSAVQFGSNDATLTNSGSKLV